MMYLPFINDPLWNSSLLSLKPQKEVLQNTVTIMTKDILNLAKLCKLVWFFLLTLDLFHHTKGDDRDPLDMVVISELITFTGCAVDCRIIGAMKAEQKGKGKKIRNDRYIVIPDISELFKETYSSNQLPKTYMKQLETFFKNYNEGSGKDFKVLEILDHKKAEKLLENLLNK